MPSIVSDYFAVIPFTYDGIELERGEILKLHGCIRDDQLIGLNYFRKWDTREHQRKHCDTCGKRFATEGFYFMHKAKLRCTDPSKPITRDETAQLIGTDPSRISHDPSVIIEQDPRSFGLQSTDERGPGGR